MNKTYLVAGFTAMMTLGYSKSFAFETTTITITCGGTNLDCISATRTDDFVTDDGGYIVCLCPSDQRQLIKYSCVQSGFSNGMVIDDWTTTGCFSCSSYAYNNGGSCSACPGDLFYTRSDTGAVSANECYKEADVERSDETGTFIFTDNCYYDGATSDPVEDSYEASTTTTAT